MLVRQMRSGRSVQNAHRHMDKLEESAKRKQETSRSLVDEGQGCRAARRNGQLIKTSLWD